MGGHETVQSFGTNFEGDLHSTGSFTPGFGLLQRIPFARTLIFSMPNQPATETELLRAAYAAFNARDIDAALALMTPDVEWPRAFKGGFVQGPEAISAYWTEQWGEIDPHVEPVAFHREDAEHTLVEVHQVVRDLAGTVLADERVGHRFTMKDSLIGKMEVGSLSSFES